MSIEIKVPALPESVADATLVAWHIKAGDSVSRDDNLVDLETDKIVLEVPAPSSGVIAAIKVETGATVVAGDVLFDCNLVRQPRAPAYYHEQIPHAVPTPYELGLVTEDDVQGLVAVYVGDDRGRFGGRGFRYGPRYR